MLDLSTAALRTRLAAAGLPNTLSKAETTELPWQELAARLQDGKQIKWRDIMKIYVGSISFLDNERIVAVQVG